MILPAIILHNQVLVIRTAALDGWTCGPERRQDARQDCDQDAPNTTPATIKARYPWNLLEIVDRGIEHSGPQPFDAAGDLVDVNHKQQPNTMPTPEPTRPSATP